MAVWCLCVGSLPGVVDWKIHCRGCQDMWAWPSLVSVVFVCFCVSACQFLFRSHAECYCLCACIILRSILRCYVGSFKRISRSLLRFIFFFFWEGTVLSCEFTRSDGHRTFHSSYWRVVEFTLRLSVTPVSLQIVSLRVYLGMSSADLMT